MVVVFQPLSFWGHVLQAWLGKVFLSSILSLQIDPKRRPAFVELVQNLEEIKQRSQMAIVLADISNLNISKDAVMSKTILEKILGMWGLDDQYMSIW